MCREAVAKHLTPCGVDADSEEGRGLLDAGHPLGIARSSEAITEIAASVDSAGVIIRADQPTPMDPTANGADLPSSDANPAADTGENPHSGNMDRNALVSDLLQLMQVADTALSTIDLDELLSSLLLCLIEITAADAAIILLRYGDEMSVHTHIRSEGAGQQAYTIPVGHGFAGTIARTLRPLYISDAQSDPLVTNPFTRGEGIRSMLGVPMMHKGDLIGVLHVDWQDIHPQDKHELRILEMAAARCAASIVNARLHEQSKQMEETLRRLNRTLKAHSHSDKAMMRATDESEYLQEVCEIIVEDCGFSMVWIGLAEDDEGKTVRPVAQAGFEEGYLETLKITWADTERGHGPTGTAIRTGKPCGCRNMLADPRFGPWREAAMGRGYASSIVLPLLDRGKAFGAMSIYSKEPDPFTEDEVGLLGELAADLAYGMSAIRLRIAHDQAEKALRQSEAHYRTLFSSMSEGFALHEMIYDGDGKPVDYRFLEMNEAFERQTGLGRDSAVGRTMKEVAPGDGPHWAATYGKVAMTGEPASFEDYSSALGTWYQVYSFSPARDQFAVLFTDITERKRTEEERESVVGLLNLANQPRDLDDFLDALIAQMHERTACEAIAVRLAKDDDFPYYKISGFPDDFVQSEARLCAYGPGGEILRDGNGRPSLECMCGNIVCGRFDPSRTYFTPYGSFWSNSVTELRERTTEDDHLLTNSRGRCMELYESVALIPFRSADRIHGMIQINGRQKNAFTSQIISHLEELCVIIANVIARKQAEEALRASREQLQAIIDNSPSYIYLKDRSGRFTIVNKSLADSIGLTSEDLIGLDSYSVVPADDAKEIMANDLRVIEAGQPMMIEEVVMRSDGIHTFLSQKFPLRDSSGEIYAMGGISTQITERKRQEQELDLARAEAERRAAELETFVSNIADGVMLFDTSSNILMENDAVRRLLGISPGGASDSETLRGKLQTMDGGMIPPDQSPFEEVLRGMETRDERFRIVTPSGVSTVSISGAAVRDAEEQVVGGTLIFHDISTLVELERQREIIIRRERHISQILQQALIPPQITTRAKDIIIGVKYKAAMNEAEVGGDFYDVFDLGNGRLGVLIGDVAGKGLPAAIRVAAARYSVRGYAYIDPSPSRVLALANDALYRETSGEPSMITALFAIVDTSSNSVTYAAAGHEPPVICRATGEIEQLGVGGVPLGITDAVTYTDTRLDLQPGDTIMMVTDGVTEARAPGVGMFGKKGIFGFLTQNRSATPDEVASGLLEEATRHAGGRLQDDAAIVVIMVDGGVVSRL